MNTQCCTRCKQEKTYDLFAKDKKRKLGISTRCKECLCELAREYGYYHKHKTERAEYGKKYRNQNAEKRSKNDKEYRKEKGKWLYERRKAREAALSVEEKKKLRDARAAIKRRKREKSPMHRVKEAMRHNVWKALKQRNTRKNRASWEMLVGYTVQELKEHLEKHFTPEMTWENYGSYWHIDHIRPQSWFTFETSADLAFKECWALNNLQPLEAKINWGKGNRREGK